MKRNLETIGVKWLQLETSFASWFPCTVSEDVHSRELTTVGLWTLLGDNPAIGMILGCFCPTCYEENDEVCLFSS